MRKKYWNILLALGIAFGLNGCDRTYDTSIPEQLEVSEREIVSDRSSNPGTEMESWEENVKEKNANIALENALLSEEDVSDADVSDADVSEEDVSDADVCEENVSDEKIMAYAFVNPLGEKLEERIAVPPGYERTTEAEGSFGDFLRNYPLLPDGSPVLLYDGREKANDCDVCVFDMHLGEKDLQQCADSVIRIYAEYMRATGMEEKIAFHFVSGFLCDWTSYKSGKRVSVNGNNVSWKNGGAASNSDETFESYLETVFNYASTLSMDHESQPIDISELQIGDIFIKGGAPGHVVMVVDTCECDGKKAFLLAQGYMPAQQFYVLKNKTDDPWYYVEEVTYPFWTPEYVFDEESLKRPCYIQ